MYNTIIQFFFHLRHVIQFITDNVRHVFSTRPSIIPHRFSVSEPSQVHPPTVRPLPSLVSDRHDTCPESRRRVQSTVTCRQPKMMLRMLMMQRRQQFHHHLQNSRLTRHHHHATKKTNTTRLVHSECQPNNY